MWLKKIKLQYFKNYESIETDFSEGLNGFVGKNGSGKTNLLDAIHYLSLTKSAFNASDKQNILHDEDFFIIEGFFQDKEEEWKVRCVLQKGKKKVFLVNQNPYETLSEHVGRFPVVLIAPDDQALIEEGSEARRRFFDNLFSQIDKQYLISLIRYNKILKQRNSLLKQFFEEHFFDKDLLSTFDMQLLEEGAKICEKRKIYIKNFKPIFEKHYQFLSNQSELPELKYHSHFLTKDFLEQFKSAREKDLHLQRTTKGTHRDDYELLLDNHSLKRFGSQGQKKSVLIALKLAKFDNIFLHKKIKPLLLMDDIFDKLDEERMNKLLERVASQAFGQIFITDARPERTTQVIQNLEMETKILNIQKGTIQNHERI